MKKVCTLISICFFLGIGAALPAWGFDGIDIPLLKKQAEQGDPDSQSKLGVMYASGVGMKMDKTEAVKLLRKAADQGDISAQFNLGVIYETGDGVPENHEEAAKWYLKAAEQGYANAQMKIGLMYDTGDGVPQDPGEAFKWFRLAAKQGHFKAIRRLELVLQAVVENYEEYKDYNTTTTQSDYGENLHVLLDFLKHPTLGALVDQDLDLFLGDGGLGLALPGHRGRSRPRLARP